MSSFLPSLLLLLLPTLLLSSSITLSSSPSIVLSYSFPSSSTIRLTLDFATQGYCSIGFGSSMTNADILLAYLENGSPAVKDTYSTGHGLPATDAQQDWNLISGERTADKTTFIVERALKTGDAKDIDIVPNQTFDLIWAYGASDSIVHHAGRGVASGIVFSTSADKVELQ